MNDISATFGNDLSVPVGGVPTPDLRRVLEGGFCIGCGACASVPGSGARMRLDEFGLYQPVFAGPADAAALPVLDAVCPFSPAAPDEDALAAEIFAGPGYRDHPRLGRILGTWAGHVTEPGFRERGASGGMGSWLSSALLRAGLVDAVVHVKETGEPGTLFRFAISRSEAEVAAGAKSRYYPVTLEDVVAEVRRRPGRYAFTGIPCFIKAIRLLARQDAGFAQSVAFCIGLVCGHMKTAGFAESLAWQLGIEPRALTGIDFRYKLPGAAANKYGIKVRGVVDGQPVERTGEMLRLFGRDWGWGLFKPRACDYCDDVVAELADVTIGDAWLKQYVDDGGGSNVVVVRNPAIQSLIATAAAEGRLRLDALDAEDVVRSQGSGFDHRGPGLAYRLAVARARGEWVPRKRVQPLARLTGSAFERRHELRVLMARTSHVAFRDAKRSGRLRPFAAALLPDIRRYEALMPGFRPRMVARVRRWLNRLRGGL